MWLFVGLALLNGVLIGTGRAINGHLGKKVGALRTSLWVHAVGFIFLSMVIGILYRDRMTWDTDIPATAWLGGVLGVLFVALSSHVVPRLGASLTASLVVAAQMLASLAIDSFSRPISVMTFVGAAGAVMIVAGVWVSANVSRR